jgi:membrane protease YdiL (CAAX protease family)
MSSSRPSSSSAPPPSSSRLEAPSEPTAWRRRWSAFVAAPAYPPNAADLRTISIVGVEMPFRAAVAIVVVTFAILLDYTRVLIPPSVQAVGLSAEGMRFQAFERFLLFGVVPLAVVLVIFRDSPARYGVRLGDWRWGVSLLFAGIVLMTPVVVGLAGLDAFRDYYSTSRASVPDLLMTYTVDLVPSEFLLRGFLMFALMRVFGGIGLLLATMPFVFAHIGKPAIETYSTMFGGLVYGWVNWRTGSIAYSAAAHIYIVTLLHVLTG